ncbi:auxin-responsive protein SAUR67-like, partial [Hibiscus syriacus]|uniref:auxin-responsive protein SAUR67-like n=1 Tax=Hibiscus syriacus TaxID=106335 RepID=UPI00192183EC
TISRDKGHFVVYTMDKERFVIPLPYLKNSIFQQLFKMSGEEFGLSSDGPIRLPVIKGGKSNRPLCNTILLVQRGLTKGLKKAAHSSITAHVCSSYITIFQEGQAEKQWLVCGF